MEFEQDNNKFRNKIFKSVFLYISIFLVSYFLGAVTIYKKTFPFDELRIVKNMLFGGSLIQDSGPKPRNTIFETFSPQSDIVMIGDSITEGALWNEIYPTVKIANRGIGGDRTIDILHRMEPIFSTHPKKAFLMAGINDLNSEVTVDTVFNNYVNIVKQLRDKGIVVYIQSTIECTKSKCGNKVLADVRSLNIKLLNYAKENKIQYININDGLTTEDDGLLSKYTPEGIHLFGNGYLIWSKTISKYIYN